MKTKEWVARGEENRWAVYMKDESKSRGVHPIPVADVLVNEEEEMDQREVAHLIAAAPELLEALELVLNDNRLMNVMNKTQARAIMYSVVKAKGEA